MTFTIPLRLHFMVLALYLWVLSPPRLDAEWLIRNPPDFVNTVSAIAQAGQNRWIAVGEAGMIRMSDNGSGGSADWTLVSSGTKDWLRAAHWANDLWIAVGDRGRVLTSLNRKQWSAQETGTTANLTGVSYENGQWVVVGDNGTVLRSTNGLDWVLAPIKGIQLNLTTIANSSNLWVVGSENGIIFTSRDAQTWRARTLPTKDTFSSIRFGNGMWVAAAGRSLLSSRDGDRWTLDSEAPHIVTAVHCNSWSWAATGLNGLILISEDGLSWTTPTYLLSDPNRPMVTPPSNDFYAVNYSSDIWTFAGSHGSMWLWIVAGSEPTVRPAADTEASRDSIRTPFRTIVSENNSWSAIGDLGTNITQSTPPVDTWFHEVHGVWGRSGTPQKIDSAAVGPSRWICVGPDGGLFESINQGRGWVQNNDSGTRENFTDVKFSDGIWVIVGEHGTVRWRKEVDPQLYEWNAASLPASERLTSLFGVAHGGRKWIAVGDAGVVLESYDGIRWAKNSQLMREGRLTSIHHNGVKWVTVGEDGNIWNSKDGVEWQKAPSPVQDSFHHVSFGNGQWAITGDHGVLLVSEDADSWFQVRVPADVRLWCAEMVAGSWVVVGEEGLGLVCEGRLVPLGMLQATPRESGLRFYWQSEGSQSALEMAPHPSGPWRVVPSRPIRSLSGWQLDLPLPGSELGFFRVQKPE